MDVEKHDLLGSCREGEVNGEIREVTHSEIKKGRRLNTEP